MVKSEPSHATAETAEPDANAAERLSFAALCRMLEAVERTPKSDAKLQLVFSDALRTQLQGGDLYPLLRLILPQLDRERTYNLKEKKIAKVYIDVLGMATESRDAQKLEHFNDPTVVQSKSVGDFAAVLFDVLQYRSLVGNHRFQHTVGVVNALLDRLVRADDAASRRLVFMQLATEFPANEQKWIVRIMLKDLKIGLRHERVLNYIHPDATEMYNHTNDLHKVCLDLRNSSIRYVPKIEPFQVFSPMLAKRVDFGECTSAIQADAFVMEPKLDGERITCHVQGETVQFISRNGVNYTDLYGVSMAPHVKAQLLPGIDVILDGEMMVWDNLEYRLREFGLLKNVANALKAGESTHRWLCYVVWDIVYLGSTESHRADELLRQVYSGPGEVSAVMGLPLHARRRLLLKVLRPLDHRVIIIEQTLVNSKSAKERHDLVMAEVDRQVANGGEGVILKDINSHYMCGESSRKTKKWIKLKPDYAGMTTNLDVLIIGGFYGTGRRRSGNVSVFLLGVLDRALDDAAAEEASKPGTPIPTIYTFAKVGTGYNREELEQLRRELEPHWQTWDSDNIPAHFNGWKPQKSDLKPDVWIDPRHSKILEVYGFELTFTSLYQTGLTIRFPRCKAIRNDKPWFQCMSVQDLNSIRGSIFNKRAADVALGQKKSAKRVVKRVAISRGSGGVIAEYSQARLDGVEQRHNIFEGQEFCVLPGKYENEPQVDISEHLDAGNATTLSKQVVEKLLHSYGATIVQNPIHESTNYIVAASDSGFKVANLKKQGKFNIVYLRWVLGSIRESRMLPLKARDFVFTTEGTRALLAKEYDRFGDHFTDDVAPEELRAIFREVGRLESTAPRKDKQPWQARLSLLLEEEQGAMDSELTCLSHCVVYVDRYHSVVREKEVIPENDEIDPFGSMKALEQNLRLLGARVSRVIDDSVTHVVISERSDRQRIVRLQPAIRALRHRGVKEPPVVVRDWADECIKQHQQLPVDDFFVAL
ncbi:hypothetical protein PINS_up008729 [Pythium insidiosum]|nr:hypothetical protein PINS_up008729 [Pythium insidiosum]